MSKDKEAPKATEEVKTSGNIVIRIGRPSEDKSGGVTVICNTVKTFIPFDVDTEVSPGVVDILNHATEPYPIVVKDERGVKKTAVKMRQRWTMVVVPPGKKSD